MYLDWLAPNVEAWRDRAGQGRIPHAVLLVGPRGVGKRALAAWLARERLGLPGAEDGPVHPPAVPEHADLHWVSPVEDRETISIDQIRALVADFSLTSYEGRGKIAVIEPANAMTAAAANSLLKTLEEPPGDALLVLVADRLGWLPATILSRCQRIPVPLPPAAVSLAWLGRWQASDKWREALRLAGEAPLSALAAVERLDEARGMLTELVAVGQGTASPIDVADRWSKAEPAVVLDWMARTVQRAVRAALGGPGAERELPESVLRHMDRRKLFCYLDTINRVRAQQPGSYNFQLTLESLLIDWAGGLKDCHRGYSPGSTLPLLTTR